ncbi:MAG TPA: hypothetical protein VNI01_13295 [Elusimicrobiota bacterium]|jgi:hypothetical protein|nr:hypothetical protein [Elusimicrobiota bacterium]
MFRCLGILREVQNSPNRETDDALILKAVLAQLENLGVRTTLATPEQFDGISDLSAYDLALPMCESYPRLMRIQELAKKPGPMWVNPMEAVFNCYRTRTTALLSGREDVRFPPTELRRVDEGGGAPPLDFPAPQGWWLKRGDVHNTCDHDVVRANSWPEAKAILKDFALREITHYVVQPHIDGDLVKFYGVGPGKWFTWFYHDPTRARRIPFLLDRLAGQAAAGARALGLEVFGGDAIIAPDGSVTVIDLNSWPSFALVRQEAAVQISWHLQVRLTAGREAGSRRVQ